MKILVTASILGVDLQHLQAEIASVEAAGADWIQVDVMDGHFVSNVTFSASDLQGIRTTLPLDIHLMVMNPPKTIY